MLKTKRYYIILGLIITLLILVSLFLPKPKNNTQITSHTPTITPTIAYKPEPSKTEPIAQAFTPPLSKYKDRVTKKPFGIYITPSSSPVSPEKFTGFHTGTDFEAFTDEADTDVPVQTICRGKLLRKEHARGYGGMMVQACTQNSQPVTIIYGHLKLESVSAKIGDELQQGALLGLLGKGYSTETSGERKHLHLGVHKGTQVVTNGYRPSQSDLKDWLDVMDYIK